MKRVPVEGEDSNEKQIFLWAKQRLVGSANVCIKYYLKCRSSANNFNKILHNFIKTLFLL